MRGGGGGGRPEREEMLLDCARYPNKGDKGGVAQTLEQWVNEWFRRVRLRKPLALFLAQTFFYVVTSPKYGLF